jgi:ankyrin repeat protein
MFAQNGRTSLIEAAIGGHFDCVRLLLEGGADKETKNTVRHLAHLFTVYSNRLVSVCFDVSD